MRIFFALVILLNPDVFRLYQYLNFCVYILFHFIHDIYLICIRTRSHACMGMGDI